MNKCLLNRLLTPYWDGFSCWEIFILLGLLFCLFSPVVSEVVIDKWELLVSALETYEKCAHSILCDPLIIQGIFLHSFFSDSSHVNSLFSLKLTRENPGQLMRWGPKDRVEAIARRQTYPKVKKTLVRTRTLWSSGFSLTVVQTVLWILKIGLWV